MSAFSDTLIELRKARGLRQSDVARKTGFNHSYVSRIEADKRFASRETALAMAVAMDLDHVETARLLWAGGFVPPTGLDYLPAEMLHGPYAVAVARKYSVNPALVNVILMGLVSTSMQVADVIMNSVCVEEGADAAAD